MERESAGYLMTIWDDSASMSGAAECTTCNSTVICRRMPGSDRCRTKGVVVYRYVPSLLHFPGPPILCVHPWEAGPLLLQPHRLIWMWWRGEKRAGGFVETESCSGSEPNKLCREPVLLLFSSYSPHQVVCLPVSTCWPGMPLLDNRHMSRRMPTNTSQTRVEDTEFRKQASYVTVDFCAFKITLNIAIIYLKKNVIIYLAADYWFIISSVPFINIHSASSDLQGVCYLFPLSPLPSAVFVLSGVCALKDRELGLSVSHGTAERQPSQTSG